MKVKQTVITALMLAGSLNAADAKAGSSLYLNINERSETVNDIGAFTSRERLGLFGKYGMFAYKVEGSFNSNLVDIAAPYDEDINRLSQGYLSLDVAKTKIKAGRQVITEDDHRFIGHVGWRQTYQTFDAVTISTQAIDKMKIDAGYIYGRNGIKKAFVTAPEDDSYLTAKYTLSKDMSILAYDYYIKDRNTIGAKVAGKASKLAYTAALATQSGKDKTGTYAQAGVNGKSGALLYGAAYELQSTNFATPYATLHKFQGWSDKLLGKAATGSADIADIAVTLGYKSKGFGTFKFIPHYFAVSGGDATEYDALYVRGLGVKGLKFLAKYALFVPADGSSSTQKVIFDLNYKFETGLF